MWVAVTVFMAAVLALCTRLWPVGLGVVCVLALVSGAAVNPLMHGLGDLTNSSAAATVRHVDKSIVARDGQNWASDSGDVNALLNAQGVNNLSSYNDPVHKSAWRVLDPRGQYEEQWNRFGYIVFQWEAGRPSLKVENPAEDIVLVTIDPCDHHFAKLRLRVVVSSEPLPDATCLTQVTQMRWMGKPAIVYERTATPGS